MSNESNLMRITFAAIDPYLQTNIVQPTEKRISGKDLVEWGERNRYPEYLLDLTKTVPSLRSIIEGTVDFIVGDNQVIAPLVSSYDVGVLNTHGDTVRDIVEGMARSLKTYGGFALQVIRSASGKVVEIYHIDLRFLRSNKENTVFYYSEKWKDAGNKKVIVYPRYQAIDEAKWLSLTSEEKERSLSSIYYYKGNDTQVYPFPEYGAAVKACEMERGIADFHLNALDNCFTSSMIVNFNNGLPSDEERKEIEKNLNEKFSGHENAGRIMCAFNDDKDHQATVFSPKVEDFGARYDALNKYARQQIFTAFRANPNLFGIPTESLGFSSEEYEAAFRLYNRTAVRPAQRVICDAFDRIYGQTGVLTISPFSLDEGTAAASETKVN